VTWPSGCGVTAVIALRAAAFVALLRGARTLFLRQSRHGVDEIAVIDAMKAHYFDFGGSSRSYWDLYFGYGLIAAVVVFVEAVLFWQLADASPAARPLVKSIALLFIGFNLVHALLAAKYFFITPIIPDVLIALCLTVAVLDLRV
jgi:hypothetical protein